MVWESVHLRDHSPALFDVWLPASPLQLLLVHTLRALILLCMSQNTHSGWWGCISYQVVPVCLQVYTPVPRAAVCDSWYGFRPESLLHGHASGSVKTHMDIKHSQRKLILFFSFFLKSFNKMKKKKTDSCDPRSDLLTSLCVVAGKVEIICNFFHGFPSIVANTTHTHTRVQKDFLLSLLAHTENLNRNMHPHTRKHWPADTKPQKLCAAPPRLHNLYFLTNTLKI